MLGQEAVGIVQIAKETSVTRQTVYRIKDEPAGAEAPMAAWERCGGHAGASFIIVSAARPAGA
jgi:DNA invertase Pin-like site-specific DNA recombinase